MKSDKVSRYVKAGAAILGAFGVIVSPDQIDLILGGFMAVYSIVSAIQAKLAE
jgi:hypothetical protein